MKTQAHSPVQREEGAKGKDRRHRVPLCSAAGHRSPAAGTGLGTGRPQHCRTRAPPGAHPPTQVSLAFAHRFICTNHSFLSYTNARRQSWDSEPTGREFWMSTGSLSKPSRASPLRRLRECIEPIACDPRHLRGSHGKEGLFCFPAQAGSHCPEPYVDKGPMGEPGRGAVRARAPEAEPAEGHGATGHTTWSIPGIQLLSLHACQQVSNQEHREAGRSE